MADPWPLHLMHANGTFPPLQQLWSLSCETFKRSLLSRLQNERARIPWLYWKENLKRPCVTDVGRPSWCQRILKNQGNISVLWHPKPRGNPKSSSSGYAVVLDKKHIPQFIHSSGRKTCKEHPKIDVEVKVEEECFAVTAGNDHLSIRILRLSHFPLLFSC